MDIEPYYKWSKSKRKRYLNGCGPGRININFIFQNDCFRHDYYYTVGKTRKERRQADIRFLKDMKRTIKKHDKYKYFYYCIAYLYYFLVRIFGNPFFKKKNKFKKK